MNKKIIDGLELQKGYAKHLFTTISYENLEDILQDLYKEILTDVKLFNSEKEELQYWKRAYFNKCCDYLKGRKAPEEKTKYVKTRMNSRWRNPRYKDRVLLFEFFTINDLIAEIIRRGLMTMEIHCCILCDAQGFSRAKVCDMHNIRRDKINKFIKRGRRQLEVIIIATYLIEEEPDL